MYTNVPALGRDWLWPMLDRDCRDVVFDWSEDLNVTYDALHSTFPNWPQFRSCIQAGGNMGVWPYLLAQKFEHVFTFEPDSVCFPCLVHNTREFKNIHRFEAALGRTHGACSLTPVEKNFGAQYITPNGDAPQRIPVFRGDDLRLSDCQLIYLDVEGFEFEALLGLYNTIGKCRPVVVVEDKGLSDKYGTPKGHIEEWLAAEFGYKVYARPHRDVVLTP